MINDEIIRLFNQRREYQYNKLRMLSDGILVNFDDNEILKRLEELVPDKTLLEYYRTLSHLLRTEDYENAEKIKKKIIKYEKYRDREEISNKGE